MRISMTAAACVMLAACGGPETSQANNAQANISDESRDTNAASPTTTANGMVMLAGPVKGQEAVRIMHERHEGMETIGKSAKSIKRELEGASPDLASVRSSATKIADLSQKASNWFPAGTGPDVGKTGVKPAIWQNQQDFGTKLHNFQVAAQAFNSAASGNDVNAIKAKWGELGQACKACHEKYRSEMHH